MPAMKRYVVRRTYETVVQASSPTDAVGGTNLIVARDHDTSAPRAITVSEPVTLISVTAEEDR